MRTLSRGHPNGPCRPTNLPVAWVHARHWRFVLVVGGMALAPAGVLADERSLRCSFLL